ncbi:MAG TPA: trehalase-like domain-containing protein, partial [Solirubrobacterales bacterium]|nr:trehalase-like domain-containing protein [Solirubrobacterales bacterium]
MKSFPNIGSYGFLSDCHTAALVSYTGSIEWLCLPRFDSPSVFGSLLDRSAGSFRMAPAGVLSPLSRRYEPGTLIVETTWFTETGWAIATDALTVPAEAEAHSRTHARGPGGPTQRPASADGGTPRTGHEADHCL